VSGGSRAVLVARETELRDYIVAAAAHTRGSLKNKGRWAANYFEGSTIAGTGAHNRPSSADRQLRTTTIATADRRLRVPLWACARRWECRHGRWTRVGPGAVGSRQRGPMPADTELRIGVFAELTATVVWAGFANEQKQQLLLGSHRLSSLTLCLRDVGFDERVPAVMSPAPSAAGQWSLLCGHRPPKSAAVG